MKSRRKTHRNLGLLTRDAGHASVRFNAARHDAPTVEPDTYYVQVDIDDPAEPDRFIALNLSIEQARHIITNLQAATAEATEHRASLADTRAKDAARQAALARWVERSQRGEPVRVTLGAAQ